MNRSTRPIARLTCAALIAGSAVAAIATAQAQAATPTVRLAGDVLPKLSTYTDLGPTAADKHVQVDITVARPNPAAEDAAYAALYDPASPNYHHFLSTDQFNAQFGVAQATFDAVKSFATAHGLTLTTSTGSRELLVLDGTAAQVERTFAVSLHNYSGDGKTFYANTAGPAVPAGLSINGVVGLNSKLGMSLPHNASNPVPTNTTHGSKPAQDGCTGGLCMGVTTPQDLWDVYKQPGGSTAVPRGNKTVDFGQGQKMAVFGEGQTDPVISNLRTFERLNNLPRVPISVIHTDGTGVSYGDNTGEVEWDLDTQSSTGMSPDVLSEVLYFGHDLSDESVLNVFNAWADDANGPLQANASYGECEENAAGDTVGSTAAAFSAGQMYTLASEAALKKAVMEGRTLFSSSGDTGSSCPLVPAATLNGLTNSVVPIVNYPASSPNAVDVGGTVLYTADGSAPVTRTLEYSWTYTGGGTSFVFAKPSYQDGITNIAGVCNYTPGGGTANVGKPCRGAPDIAALSGDVTGNGYAIVADGETAYPGGGTSLSSPLNMGMWTRIQATAPKVNGKFVGLGFANPTYYKEFKTPSCTTGGEFFDIGGGTTSPPAGNGFYVSTPGWDYTSGMGVPNVGTIAACVNKTTKPTNPVLPTEPSPAPPRSSGCALLYPDSTGDDAFLAGSNTGGNPQLDIIGGNMVLSADGTTLQTSMFVNNLSTAAASAAPGAPGSSPANEYYFLWSYAGTQYFTSVEVDTTNGTFTYGDGTVAGNQYTTVHKTDTGSYKLGAKGRLTVNVPLANIGSPPLGSTLTAPGGQSKVLVGTSQTGGLIEQADNGGPKFDYKVGERCTSSS